MVRVTHAVSSQRRRKRLRKRAKGFIGDRKNHLRQTRNAVMKALAYNYQHRKEKKREFRSLWIVRISAAAKIRGISYSMLINGLKKAECDVDRRMLAELAVNDPSAFDAVVATAKQALVVAHAAA